MPSRLDEVLSCQLSSVGLLRHQKATAVYRHDVQWCQQGWHMCGRPGKPRLCRDLWSRDIGNLRWNSRQISQLFFLLEIILQPFIYNISKGFSLKVTKTILFYLKPMVFHEYVYSPFTNCWTSQSHSLLIF